MRKDSQTSIVWSYFDKVKGGAKCKHCKLSLTCFGNTSNLMKHLRRKHNDILNEVKDNVQENIGDAAECEVTEGEVTTLTEEETSETVAETNASVHTIQAYRDVNGTTFLYLQPAPEGETSGHIQTAVYQPVVSTAEAVTANGDVVPAAVQKDPAVIENHIVVSEDKTQEEATPRKLVHAPVKNYQGSSVAGRSLIRQLQRPSPVVTTSQTSNSNSSNEDSYEAFGKYIASILRNFPSKSAYKMQGQIVAWLLKEQIKYNS